MFIKLVRAVVHREHRNQFADGQRAWAAVRDQPGFAGQFGGWAQKQAEEAWIQAVWLSPRHYQRFMNTAHDGLAAVQAQAGAIAQLTNLLFVTRASIPGCMPHACRALAQTAVLRLTITRAKPGQIDALQQAQRRIWNPALAAAPGLLAGCFGQALNHHGTFLIALLWSDPQAVRRFDDEFLPDLRDRARPARYCAPLLNRSVSIVKDWVVSAPQLV